VLPIAARAQQPTIPVIGFLNPTSPDTQAERLRAFRQGLKETGYVEGENVARLELLRELVPAATRVALLINPAAAADTETMLRDVEAATSTMGLQLQIVKANTIREIDAAFAAFVRERPDVLFVSGGPFLLSRRVQLALLAARYAVPTSYGSREYAENGGLMSYGTSLTDVHRQVGVYAGRILNGTKPTDLPVVQASKFELVINIQAARTIGLEVPPSLLARADEVIE
jgi:putative ABC transport system substrate-binding protein